MADRWRDDDRFGRDNRGGYAGERQETGRSRGDYGDYDRGYGGQDQRYGRDERSAYSSWGRPDDAREFDDYTRAPSSRRFEDRGYESGGYGSGRGDMQRGERFGGGYESGGYGGSGYEGGRYGSDDRSRTGRGYGAPRSYNAPGGYGYSESGGAGYGSYQERGGGRGQLDGLRGYRTSGYDFNDEDRGSERSYRSGQQQDRGWMDRAGDEVRSWFGDDDAERRRQQDQYRGQGPKGYTRSDERIREDVCDRLSDDWRIDASDVEVQVKDGEVTLSGTVRDRELKRRAEDVADDISGVRHVQNNLRVQQNQTSSSATGSTTAASTGTTPGASSTANPGASAGMASSDASRSTSTTTAAAKSS